MAQTIAERLEKLTSREKKSLFGAALFIVLALGDFCIVRPVFARLKLFDTDIRQKEEGMARMTGLKRQGPKIAEEYRRINDLLEQASPTGLNEMREQIDKLAKENGVALPAVQNREPEKSAYFEEYIVEVGRFEGSMTNVLSLINSLQESPGMLRVMKLNISPDADKSSVKGSMLITKVVKPAGS